MASSTTGGLSGLSALKARLEASRNSASASSASSLSLSPAPISASPAPMMHSVVGVGAQLGVEVSSSSSSDTQSSSSSAQQKLIKDELASLNTQLKTTETRALNAEQTMTQQLSEHKAQIAKLEKGHAAALAAWEARAKAAETKLSKQQQASLTTTTLPSSSQAAADASASSELALEIERLKKANEHLERQAARMRQHLLDKEEEEASRADTEASNAEQKQRSALEAARAEVLQELKAQKQRADDADARVTTLQDEVNERDTEVANLQRALGALTAEAERGERQRRELAHAKAEVRNLQSAAAAAASDAASCRARVDEAQKTVQKATQEAAEFRAAALTASQNEARARRALDEVLAKQLGREDGQGNGAAVDSRVAMQVVLALLERRLSDDVVALALRVFSAGDAESARLKAAVATLKKSGVMGTVGKVAGAPLSLAAFGLKSIVGGVTSVKQVGDLSDNWLKFLEDEMAKTEEDDLVGAAVGAVAAPPPPPLPPSSSAAAAAAPSSSSSPPPPASPPPPPPMPTIAPVPAVPQSGLADIPLG